MTTFMNTSNPYYYNKLVNEERTYDTARVEVERLVSDVYMKYVVQ